MREDRHSTSRRVGSRLVVLLGIVGLAVGGLAPPVSAAPTIAVEPSTDLGATASVTVSGSGWPSPNTELWLVQCAAPLSLANCENPHTSVLSDSNGGFPATEYVVAREFTSSANIKVNCGQVGCYVVVSDSSITNYAYAPIEFAGGVEPPGELPGGFPGETLPPDGTTEETATTTTPAAGSVYVAMGDSFSSGQGLLPDQAGCARSTQGQQAWPLLMRDYFASSDPRRTIVDQPQFVACTGAKIKDVLGPDKYQGELPQIEHVGTNTRVVTLTIAGNDLAPGGLEEVVKTCIEADCTKLDEQISKGLKTIGPGLRDIIDQINKRANGNATVYVVGYPQIVGPTTNLDSIADDDMRWWMKRTKYEWTEGEDKWAREAVVDRLNSKLRSVVKSYQRLRGWRAVYFVDVAKSFAGHELGSDPEYFNRVRRTQPGSITDFTPYRSSFHPNLFGNDAYTAAVGESMAKTLDRAPMIAFDQETGAGKKSQIWLTDQENGEPRMILDGGNGQVGDSLPAISPDGTRIAFQSDRDSSGQCTSTVNPPVPPPPAGTKWPAGRDTEIWVANIDGSNPKPLTCETRPSGHPTWAPDGTELAFERYAIPTDPSVWIMNADGKQQRPLQPSGSSAPTRTWAPSWSPDGQWIAYAAYGSDIEVWRTHPAGQPSEKVTVATENRFATEAAFRIVNPEWSPDGKELTFFGIASRNEERRIYSFTLGGNGKTLVATTRGASSDWAPWSRDYLLVGEEGGLRYMTRHGNRLYSLGQPMGRNPDWAFVAPSSQPAQAPAPACTYTSPQIQPEPNPLEYVPPHVRGDKDFGGAADIMVTVAVMVTPTKVHAVIKMRAYEPNLSAILFGGNTTVDGETIAYSWTVPDGKKITRPLGLVSDPSIIYPDTDTSFDQFPGQANLPPGSHLVSNYTIFGDHLGDDAGSYTRVQAWMRPIAIRLSDCA